MREAHPETVDRAAARREGRGPAASDWLCLAATPAFAIMALLAVGFGSDMDMWCLGTHGMSSPGGMALMYALMSVFHATPWLKLACDWLGRSH
jgi:hypothetical protein